VIIEIIRSFRSKVNTAACYRCHISSLQLACYRCHISSLQLVIYQACIKEKSNRKR